MFEANDRDLGREDVTRTFQHTEEVEKMEGELNLDTRRHSGMCKGPDIATSANEKTYNLVHHHTFRGMNKRETD